jgi:hypothetical protein
MREEGVQITRDNLINIPYLAHSPELFEMIDYTTMVSDFTDLEPATGVYFYLWHSIHYKIKTMYF